MLIFYHGAYSFSGSYYLTHIYPLFDQEPTLLRRFYGVKPDIICSQKAHSDYCSQFLIIYH